MLRILITLFVCCLAALTLASAYLPWWGFLLTVAGVFGLLWLAALWLSRRSLASLFAVPFKAKGAALRRAKAEVHEVAPADPAAVPAASEDDVPRAYYTVDVTITPVPNAGPFKMWEAGELMMVPARVRRIGLDDAPEGARIVGMDVFEGGRFRPEEGLKYAGAQRLRLTVGLAAEDDRRQAFRYYFETFGEVTFPAAARGRD